MTNMDLMKLKQVSQGLLDRWSNERILLSCEIVSGHIRMELYQCSAERDGAELILSGNDVEISISLLGCGYALLPHASWSEDSKIKFLENYRSGIQIWTDANASCTLIEHKA